MISKHILFAGFTILAGATLVLQTVPTFQFTSLPADPITSTKSLRQAQLASIGSHASTIPDIPTSHVVAPPLKSDQISSIIEPQLTKIAPSPIKPIKNNTPDSIYTALPFTTGSATAAGSGSPWWLNTIHTPATVSAGPNTLIAVIDTGFALAHTALSGKWWTNPGEMGPTLIEGPAPNCTSRGLVLDKSCNNLDNDGDGYPSDWRGYDFANNDNSPQAGTDAPTGAAVGHGTFVAGLIVGTLTSSSGGVDTNARILPLQALTDSGSGTTSTVGDAIIYAADHGAQIINLSLGTSSDDLYLHQAIAYAMSKGSIVVAAAGNDGCDCMLYPANYPEVEAVGASTMSDTLASFSSYGSNLDLIAPGESLCSTSWTSTNETSGYLCGGAGTSFATPIVVGSISRLIAAGALSLLASQYADIAADKLAAMNGSWRTNLYGTGRINVTASLSTIALTNHFSVQNALLRTRCSGINACAVTISTSSGTTTYSSKAPQGQAEAVYWDSGSSSSNPTLWLLTDTNNGSTHYYSSI